MTTTRRRKSRPVIPPLLYFFYNGDLHKKLQINRGTDVLVAWNYTKGQTVKYVYSQVRREGRKAYSTTEVGQLIRRSPITIKSALKRGEIREPEFTYSLDAKRAPVKRMWTEANIMEAHTYFSGVHRGRPRNDGAITPADMPSKKELVAMLNQGVILYVQTPDGDFIPTWEAQKF